MLDLGRVTTPPRLPVLLFGPALGLEHLARVLVPPPPCSVALLRSVCFLLAHLRVCARNHPRLAHPRLAAAAAAAGDGSLAFLVVAFAAPLAR